jgi:NADH dehydrogenase
MRQLKICLLGGTGFVGHSIASSLSALGHRIVVITRRQQRHRDLLVLPTVTLVEGDVHDQKFLCRQLQGMDVVINLVGILNESGRKGEGFVRAHTRLAERVVEAVKQTRVPRLLHMSALNAGSEGPSHYLRTKGEAEELVHNGARGGQYKATSFRPSVIFGPGDSFTNRFAGLLRSIPMAFPLACPDARMQPVYIEDVTHCFVQAIQDHGTYNQRYNLCGPKVYTLYEIVEYLARVTGMKRRIVRLRDWQARAQASVMEWVPGKPFSRDNYLSLQVDSVCDGDFPTIFGCTPRSMEEIVPGYLLPHPDHIDALRRIARR